MTFDVMKVPIASPSAELDGNVSLIRAVVGMLVLNMQDHRLLSLDNCLLKTRQDALVSTTIHLVVLASSDIRLQRCHPPTLLFALSSSAHPRDVITQGEEASPTEIESEVPPSYPFKPSPQYSSPHPSTTPPTPQYCPSQARPSQTPPPASTNPSPPPTGPSPSNTAPSSTTP